jgi:thiamine biosynthesis lipoprotein
MILFQINRISTKNTSSIIFILLLWSISCSNQPSQIELSGLTMGTTYNIKIIPEKDSILSTKLIKQKIDSVLISVNYQMSTYLFDSEITQFNNHESTTSFTVSNDFSLVVERALHWSKLTDGAFDITIVPLLYLWGFGPGQASELGDIFPEEHAVQKRRTHVGYEKLTTNKYYLQKKDPFIKIDLNAIAKGFGVDAVYSFLESIGMNNIMVEIGGEVRTKGENRQNEPWMIAVETPDLESTGSKTISWALPLESKAMATSGDYRNYYEIDGIRYSHEIDPRTGYPAQTGVTSATVVATNCMDADALATALIIMGAESGLQFIEKLDGVEAFLILRNGNDNYRTIKSSGMKISAL